MCDLQAVFQSDLKKANVKVQDTVFTAASSGNRNVSLLSIALQLRSDLVGTDLRMDKLTVRGFFLMEVRFYIDFFF